MHRFLLCCLLLASSCGCRVLGPYSPLAPLERSGVFHPDRYPAGDWQPTAVLVQDAYFNADDGVKLHGWYVRAAEPKAYALLLHGNAGNVTVMAESLRLLRSRHQLTVLALDYRGFGRSEGKPTEDGILRDARAARRWLAEREEIEEADIVLLGQSLGGGVAIDLAAKEGARGLVLASTFTSLPDVAQYQVPWLPMKLMMSMQMNSLATIKEYRGPLLLSHGEADEVIPYKQGLALYEACPSPTKQMITVPGGKHNDAQPEEYRVALDKFIASLPPPKKSPVGETAAAAFSFSDRIE